MKPRSLRASLTSWFIGLTMLLLCGFSFTLDTRLHRALRDGVDAELAARAEALLGICEWDEEAEAVEFKLSAQLAAEFLAGHAGRGLEVWTWPARELLHRSGESIPGELPAGDLPAGADRATTCFDLGGAAPRRVCMLLARAPAVPAHQDDPDRPAFEVLIRVSDSLAPVDAQMRRVLWETIALVGVAGLVVLAFGAFLSRRFLQPLRRLGEAAENVRAGESARMPRRGSGDELDQLAAVLDRTFASLADALDRQARFTANAAHELRNPIAVVRSAAEVALRHERSGGEYRRFLDDVHQTSLRMGRIVEALLTLARLDARAAHQRFKEVDLVKLARDAVASIERGVGSAYVKNDACGTIRGEEALLRVLVDNLLANALQYAEGKPVEVDIAAQAGGRVALRVRDFGPGVPDRDKPRIFERFYRGETPAQGHAGSGLGLSIVADVARLHGASCRVEDALPGTRVTVEFAAATGAPVGAT